MISILQVDVELFYQTWHHPNLLLQRKKNRKKLFVIQMRLASAGSYFYTQLSFFRLFRHFFFKFFNHKFTCDFTLGARKYSSVKTCVAGGRQMMETTSTHANEENVNQQKTHRPETNRKKPFLPPPPFYQSANHIYSAPFCLKKKTVTSAQCKKVIPHSRKFAPYTHTHTRRMKQNG